MKYFSLIVMLFLIVFAGCKKDDSPVSQDTSAVLMPLSVGNQWVYVDSIFTESGALDIVDTVTLGITGKRTVVYEGKNVEVFYWNWIYKGVADQLIWLCRNESDGLNSYGLQASESNYVLKKSQWLKFPVNVGESWKNYSFVYSDSTKTFTADTSLYTCTSVNEKVKTAKGEYECYSYLLRRVFPEGTYEIYMYMSKNVGYVGLVTKINGVIREKYSLLSTSGNNPLSKNAAQKEGNERGKREFPIFNLMR